MSKMLNCEIQNEKMKGEKNDGYKKDRAMTPDDFLREGDRVSPDQEGAFLGTIVDTGTPASEYHPEPDTFSVGGVEYSNRLDLSDGDFARLIRALENAGEGELVEIVQRKRKRVRSMSEARRKALAAAREERTRRAKEEIENAINLLRLMNQKITVAAVAREAGVSYATAKKYLPQEVLVNKK